VGHTSTDSETWWVAGNELGSQWSVESSVDGHQRAADLGIRGGIDLATLDAAEEVVQLIESALTGVEWSSLVSHVVTAGVPHGRRLVIVQRLIRLGLVVGVVAAVPVLMRLTKGSLVSTNGAIVVVVA
jgi:hypothetical protein